MHRLPLQLPVSPSQWDRKLPEYELFRKTLLCGNIVEAKTLNEALIQETDTFHDDALKIYLPFLIEALKLIERNNNSDASRSLYLLNLVILRAPTNSVFYVRALKERGVLYLMNNYTQFALNDFEMFLNFDSEHKRKEDILLVHGAIANCCYVMQEFDKAKYHIVAWRRQKVGMSAAAIKKVDKFISKYTVFSNLDAYNEDALDKMNFKSKWARLADMYLPHEGFNSSTEIPLCSSKCYITKVSEDAELEGIFTKQEILKGEIVMVEDPILFSFATPFANCEKCFSTNEQLYTCTKCQLKTYCSLNCMQQDEEEHRDECKGYKYPIFLMLDAKKLFRLFMRVVKYLKQEILETNSENLRLINSVKEAWEFIINRVQENLSDGPPPFMNFVVKSPDYKKLTPLQYVTLITHTFRLTIFISDNFEDVKNVFNMFSELSYSQKINLIGAILLRLNCHIIENSKEIELKFAVDSIAQATETIEENVDKSKNKQTPHRDQRKNKKDPKPYIMSSAREITDTIELIKKKSTMLEAPKFPQTKQTLECTRISNTMSNYMDNLVETHFDPDGKNFFLFSELSDRTKTQAAATNMSSLLMHMGHTRRLELSREFYRNFLQYIDKYFMHVKSQYKAVRQIVSLLCTTLNKFNHSCMPNIEVIQLNNGTLLGKALQNIVAGEELTVCHRANAMYHNRNERESFLKQNYIECHGKCCEIPIEDEPTNKRGGILCGQCLVREVRPIPGKCPKCESSYHQQLMASRYFITAIESEIAHKELKKETAFRELRVLYDAYFKYVQVNFVESNEYRIRAELKYAKFLAKQNFFADSSDLLYDIRKHIVNYHENAHWFDFYDEMLKIIIFTMQNTIDNMSNLLDEKRLSKICALGMFIIEEQEKHVIFYHGSDSVRGPILAKLIQFHKWKLQINGQCTLTHSQKEKFFN